MFKPDFAIISTKHLVTELHLIPFSLILLVMKQIALPLFGFPILLITCLDNDRLNWTPLGPFTITNQHTYKEILREKKGVFPILSHTHSENNRSPNSNQAYDLTGALQLSHRTLMGATGCHMFNSCWEKPIFQ